MTTTSATTSVTTTSAPALLSGDLLDLISRSQQALAQACCAPSCSQRYVDAHLAALRAAAALLAQVAPRSLGARPRSAWEAVADHAPELAEWTDFFAACARRSRAAQAGLVLVSAREADDLVRGAESFLAAVLRHVGLPPVAPMSARLTPAAAG